MGVMDFDDDFDGAAVTLHPRGWLRSFSIAFKDYPKTAVALFTLGVIATALDVISFGVILAGLELFKADGEVKLFGLTISGPLNRRFITPSACIDNYRHDDCWAYLSAYYFSFLICHLAC